MTANSDCMSSQVSWTHVPRGCVNLSSLIPTTHKTRWCHSPSPTTFCSASTRSRQEITWTSRCSSNTRPKPRTTFPTPSTEWSPSCHRGQPAPPTWRPWTLRRPWTLQARRPEKRNPRKITDTSDSVLLNLCYFLNIWQIYLYLNSLFSWELVKNTNNSKYEAIQYVLFKHAIILFVYILCVF